jgi:hypothetical protein
LFDPGEELRPKKLNERRENMLKRRLRSIIGSCLRGWGGNGGGEDAEAKYACGRLRINYNLDPKE